MFVRRNRSFSAFSAARRDRRSEYIKRAPLKRRSLGTLVAGGCARGRCAVSNRHCFINHSERTPDTSRFTAFASPQSTRSSEIALGRTQSPPSSRCLDHPRSSQLKTPLHRRSLFQYCTYTQGEVASQNLWIWWMVGVGGSCHDRIAVLWV